MHSELQEAVDFHAAIVAEGKKALVGYEREKALANMVLLSEIPTTYDHKEHRQVNAGNLLLRGVPGVGKTFFGVILAAIFALGLLGHLSGTTREFMGSRYHFDMQGWPHRVEAVAPQEESR